MGWLSFVAAEIDSLTLAVRTEDVRFPRTNTSVLTDTVKLGFDAMDAEGRPTTSEAGLKQLVLSCDSSTTVTVAAGVLKSACGIVGMGGVDKAVALWGWRRMKTFKLVS